MATINEEFKMFMNQLRGTQNIFGYRSTKINRLYFLFCFICLFCGTKFSFGKNIKRFVHLIYLLSFTLTSVHLMGALLFTIHMDPALFLRIICTFLCTLYSLVLIPLVSYCCRKRLEQLFQIFDDTTDCNIPIPVQSEQNLQFKFKRGKMLLKSSLHLFSLLIICASLYGICTLAYCLVGYSVEKVQSPFSYLAPTASELVTNGKTYTLIVLSQLYSLNILFFHVALIPSICLFITSEFYYRFEQLSFSVEQHSKITSENIEKFSFRKKKYHCDIFMENLKFYISRHCVLRKGIQHFTPFFLLHTLNLLVIFFGVEIENISHIMLLHAPMFHKLRVAAMFISTTLIFWVSCYVGKLFEEMNELFALNVYNIPWYYLSPKDRKTVYIFLHEAQRPITFLVLKVYPTNVAMFMQMSRMVYSYVSILRTFVSR